LQQACPAPVDATVSQPATTVATLTDTLGNVYRAALPAIAIAYPDWNRTTGYAAGDRVSYLGVSWQATGAVTGQAPGKGKFWVQIDTVGYPLWTTGGKYATGDRVAYQGQIWEATQQANGQTPGKGKFWVAVDATE
ncbi:MAG: hypothetical protein FWD85_13375, partial [Microbacteriaceae bacterium]|nr:hypothetical protein [Microbacteriaceae bacterium]